MPEQTILTENKTYWTGRAAGYSEVNQLELTTAQRQKWSNCLHAEITKQYPACPAGNLRVLEVGTGPGFFAIILCELGYDVTAIDLTPAMLEEAKKNAGEAFKNVGKTDKKAGEAFKYTGENDKITDESVQKANVSVKKTTRIKWIEMNAEDLQFEDDSFDVVISRNLTWNLPHPDKAYAEWARVLRPGGLLLNFDANWYAYLFDGEAQAAYDQDRVNSAEQGVWDQNVGENFDIMEYIALRFPLSNIRRPAWDLEQLQNLGLSAEADEQIWQDVWSEEEKLNFSSTPMFMVRGVK